jgi:hypothetical protein
MVGSFDDPPALVSPQFTSILVAALLAVLPVRDNQFNAALFEPLAQRVGIISTAGYSAFLTFREFPKSFRICKAFIVNLT